MSFKRQTYVVAAAIVDDLTHPRRLLAARRTGPPELAGQWELPGGKIEPGESPVEALARELREELGVTVEVGRIWEVLHHRYPDYEVVMLVYVCQLAPGQVPRCLEVADLAWCTPGDLGRYDILPADAPLVDRLLAEGVPPA
jgi:8-oxo-dGTP diphosphatase